MSLHLLEYILVLPSLHFSLFIWLLFHCSLLRVFAGSTERTHLVQTGSQSHCTHANLNTFILAWAHAQNAWNPLVRVCVHTRTQIVIFRLESVSKRERVCQSTEIHCTVHGQVSLAGLKKGCRERETWKCCPQSTETMQNLTLTSPLKRVSGSTIFVRLENNEVTTFLTAVV